MTQFVYGKNVVKQILIENKRAKCVYLNTKDPEIVKLANQNHIPFQIVGKKELLHMVKTDRHQGVVCAVEPYTTYTLDDVMNSVPEGRHGLIILLDELEDPHNLGAILRTADAVQADGVIYKKTNAVGLTPTVAKVSAGAIETVKCCEVTNLSRAIEKLQKAGWWAVGADMDGQDYRSLDYAMNTVLVIGNEGSGISRLVREKCDYIVSLPMRGKITSLNASVSAGILMYEICSKRFPL